MRFFVSRRTHVNSLPPDGVERGQAAGDGCYQLFEGTKKCSLVFIRLQFRRKKMSSCYVYYKLLQDKDIGDRALTYFSFVREKHLTS